MSYTAIKKLPQFETILREIPMANEGYEKICCDRKKIKNILSGQDGRLLMIIGPCSAWPREAVLAYAQKLQILNNSLNDVLKIVMRVYTQKPRTVKGWTGPMNQPNPLKYPDAETGLRYVRRMMIDVISIGLPVADEVLFTHNLKGCIELLSLAVIGARSTEDQEHRIFASSLDCPVGLKNPTHGSLSVGVNSVIAAQQQHVAVFNGHEVQTDGNPYAHLILRGGNHQPNYYLKNLREIHNLMTSHNILNPSIIIDASHDNCLLDGKKDHRRQSHVIFTILDSIKDKPDLRKLIKGFMVESFIKGGNQKIDSDNKKIDLAGLSITDPCLSWEETEQLLLKLAHRLRQ